MKQAETQRAAADGAVTARLPETYQWLLAPSQATPQSAVEWHAIRLSGQDALAARASKKLRSDELLVPSFAATRLRMELDRVPLWRGDHVPVKQVVDDFARYLYLPRLKDSTVLLGAIRDGIAMLTWEQDSFAYAESYDEAAKRYRGLRCGQNVGVSDGDTGLLVRPQVARKQLDAETVPTPGPSGPGPGPEPGPGPGPRPPGPKPEPLPTRFFASIDVDPDRPARDVGKIADEVITHLSTLPRAKVRITVEIAAEVPGGVPEQTQRIVTENAQTMKFKTHGFEQD